MLFVEIIQLILVSNVIMDPLTEIRNVMKIVFFTVEIIWYKWIKVNNVMMVTDLIMMHVIKIVNYNVVMDLSKDFNNVILEFLQ